VARINIGTAGWSIPRQIAESFPADGTGLERYAARFPVAEINSSFHRPHRASTWERWRDSVPRDFRFSVKVPKQITHQLKLVDCSQAIGEFTAQAHILGDRLAVLLVQLPPKLAYVESVAGRFFEELARASSVPVACEPRNASWFTPAADAMLQQLGVARVAADPAICAEASRPGGARGISYWRLHGSPVMYRSSYADRIAAYAGQLQADAADGRAVWCIFDNTAASAGAADALAMSRVITGKN
jgi:uncharacterized protein YecE (DUF72 family)